MHPSLLTDPQLAKRVSAFRSTAPEARPQAEFLLWEDHRSGMSQFYAPFEYMNPSAKLILLGITPGKTQMNRALGEAGKALRSGQPVEDAMRVVKREASFCGSPMRENAIRLLDFLGYQRMLGISSCQSLWGRDDHLVHFTSVLRNPVFTSGEKRENYTGKSPSLVRSALLMKRVTEDLVPELAAISADAVIVPLGSSVAEVVRHLQQRGLIRQRLKMFEGQMVAPPHPSPANNELINLLLDPECAGSSPQDYAERKHVSYVNKYAQRGVKPKKDKATYQKTRIGHWRSMEFVRRAYAAEPVA